MPGKMTFNVYDDVHKKNAEGIEYDLWRINNGKDRVNMKHEKLADGNSHVLVEANKEEELGTFEVVIYAKDYFDRFNEDIEVKNSRYVIPFGVKDLSQDYHLNIHISPTSYTCTL
ncbi:unnamed protein product [Adineta steineri]|uniref:Transthyretin/hydroxyisourate hydrolase domain-containing protein n=1 Tax=Adineta steineri TaxID=433720 RepID=A0A818VIZ9_9BILA|nr:unnamed protein product [Adineta steineri]CAF3709655.1 unnamed protein product [Adineta steineri]